MKREKILKVLGLIGKYTAKVLAVIGKTLGVIGKVVGSILLVLVFTGVICVGAFGFYVKEYMVPKAELDVGNISMNYSSIIYATDAETGERTELTRLYGSENRIWVNYDQIPQDLVDAFIAIEDERFESHKGVDWRRTFGAVINLIQPFSSNFGGSTITQQLVKNITEETDVTIQRKVLEILRALNLERQLTKDQIMEMYLNTINLSQGCYGVSSAAYVYFGKEVSDLSLAECAVIAGITNSPTYYDPFQNPDNNKKRQELILEKMHELGRITDEEYESAVAEEIVFRDYSEETTDTSNVRSYFEDLLVTELVAELREVYGYSSTIAYKLLYAGGLSIEATIDPKVQAAIEKVYENRDNFPAVKGTTQPESAMVIFSPDGKLLGLVGGIGEKYGNLVLNRVTSRRAPGSSIKPLSVFAPAIEYGLITPYSVLDDSPSKIIGTNGALVEAESAILLGSYGLSPWPANQNRIYSGRTTINSALAQSLNTIAVRTVDLMSLETAFDFATENFGLSLMRQDTVDGVAYNDLTYSALALGGTSRGVSLLELTAAYVPFVNDGIYVEPTTYLRVLDADGNVLLDHTANESVAVSESTAYYMRSMLEYAVTNGTGGGAALDGIAVGGKTGTTSNDFDRWFVGFSPYYVGGVWFGFDQQKEISGLATNPSVDTWREVMEILHADKADAAFETPSNLQDYAYCLDSGGIPTDACRTDQRGSRVAYGKFLPEDAPKSLCTMHTTVHICTESGRMSRVFCPQESLETVSLLNLYRYFAIPNVVVRDEQYTVHFEGLLSDRILSYYYPAVAPEGNALEGQCTIHVTPPETEPPETTADTSVPENTEEPPPEDSTPPSDTEPSGPPQSSEVTPPASTTPSSATEPPATTTPAATTPPESTSIVTTPAATTPSESTSITTTPAATTPSETTSATAPPETTTQPTESAETGEQT
ncbi:MAG: hypothetical protein E7452_11215 [Ruminococcaceae bacterium]|nr:hypothetical protein [Oscillospiraceae bacterium]